MQVQAKRAAKDFEEAPEEVGGSGKRKKPRQDFGGADDEFGDDEDPFYEQAAEAAQHKKSARQHKCAAAHGDFCSSPSL